jgi:hypothetical protein
VIGRAIAASGTIDEYSTPSESPFAVEARITTCATRPEEGDTMEPPNSRERTPDG